MSSLVIYFKVMKMNEQAQELLMMFVRDGYSQSGNISRKTAIKMMRFVASKNDLQSHITNGDNEAILNYRMEDNNNE